MAASPKRDWGDIQTREKVEKILGKVAICGCGNPSQSWEIILRMLERAEDHKKNGYFYQDLGSIPSSAVEFIANVLDRWDLLEHGSGIGGAWLTIDGENLLQFIRDHGVDSHKWPEWAQ